MNHINKVILSGFISGPFEIKQLPNNKKLLIIQLEAVEKFVDKSGTPVEEKFFHRLVAWDKMATNIENNLKDGDEIFVQGKLKTRSYTDKSTQIKKITEVLISEYNKL